MGILIFIIITVIVVAIISGCSNSHDSYECGYDDLDDAYKSYYVELAETALEGDRDAMEEMCATFGDEWW